MISNVFHELQDHCALIDESRDMPSLRLHHTTMDPSASAWGKLSTPAVWHLSPSHLLSPKSPCMAHASDVQEEQYCTVQYSTVQYSTVRYSTVQCSAVQYCTVQCSAEQYSAVQCSAVCGIDETYEKNTILNVFKV